MMLDTVDDTGNVDQVCCNPAAVTLFDTGELVVDEIGRVLSDSGCWCCKSTKASSSKFSKKLGKNRDDQLGGFEFCKDDFTTVPNAAAPGQIGMIFDWEEAAAS